MHRFLATFVERKQLFLGLAPISPLIKSPSDQGLILFFSSFPFLLSSFLHHLQYRQQRGEVIDSAPSYPTSHKFGPLIFPCDARPNGEHEVQ